ncbi:MAG: hypothetical protein ABJD53_05390 [Gammaproteobacteria bacterium]
MIDVEVLRLRRLRDTAFRVRAIALALESDAAARNSALSRSAQNCWRIARVVTGVLRAHPNLSYQQDHNPLRAAYHRLSAGLLVTVARYRSRTAQLFCAELWRVSRELDDARALTWSAELSDTLGRAQLQMRRLLREFNVATVLETDSRHEIASMLQTRVETGGANSQARSGNWPYLAL